MSLSKDQIRSRIAQSDQGLKCRPGRVRRFSHGDFYNTAGWQENKAEQRRMVLAHIRETVSGRVKYLGLPGADWILETELHRTGADVLGMERNTSVAEYAIRHMPSGWRHRQRYQFRLDGNKHVLCWQDRHVWYIVADVCDLIGGQLCAHWHKMDRWAFISRHFNAIWLDLYSPVGCESFAFILRHLHRVLKRGCGCSLSCSFTVGRDDRQFRNVIANCPGNSVERRANFIRLMLRQHGVLFAVSRLYQHKSANDSGTLTIGTVSGIARVLD